MKAVFFFVGQTLQINLLQRGISALFEISKLPEDVGMFKGHKLDVTDPLQRGMQVIIRQQVCTNHGLHGVG